MLVATAKAASLLRPNGILGLIWSGGADPDDLADRLEEVYSSVVPPGTHRRFRGYGVDWSTEVRSGLTGVFDAIAAGTDLGAVTEGSGFRGHSATNGLSGSSCGADTANTLPSSRTFDTVCSTPLGRRSTTTGRLVRHELRDGPDRRDPARLDRVVGG